MAHVTGATAGARGEQQRQAAEKAAQIRLEIESSDSIAIPLGRTISAFDQELVVPHARTTAAMFSLLRKGNGTRGLALHQLRKAVASIWPGFDDPEAVRRSFEGVRTKGGRIDTALQLGNAFRFLSAFSQAHADVAGIDLASDAGMAPEELVAACKRLRMGVPARESKELFERLAVETMQDGTWCEVVTYDDFCGWVATAVVSARADSTIRTELVACEAGSDELPSSESNAYREQDANAAVFAGTLVPSSRAASSDEMRRERRARRRAIQVGFIYRNVLIQNYNWLQLVA